MIQQVLHIHDRTSSELTELLKSNIELGWGIKSIHITHSWHDIATNMASTSGVKWHGIVIIEKEEVPDRVFEPMGITPSGHVYTRGRMHQCDDKDCPARYVPHGSIPKQA